MIHPGRVYVIKDGPIGQGVVIYWMSRDQRVSDNWAFLYASELALNRNVPMKVVFCLATGFLGATLRQYGFMLRGLQEAKKKTETLGIPFRLLTGDPVAEMKSFCDEHKPGIIVTDFDPLHVKTQWKLRLAESIDIPIHEVDSHNIVPCRMASAKLEFGAYTLRPKITRLLPEYLQEFPRMKPLGEKIEKNSNFSPDDVLKWLAIDRSVPEVDWLIPGEAAALKQLEYFISEKLHGYAERRNDPTLDGLSDLSPYLHYGHISAQRIGLEMIKNVPKSPDTEAFLEELIVRRELADNYCFYNPQYDSFEGFHQWARTSLDAHRRDKREYLYSLDEFEKALTHDPLWNAAQREMVMMGKMHGYLRMYWAKKILEWTASPEEALQTAIYLNDKFELDGRDPNGYTGCAWAIGGVHDRAWGERPVFGKIRYMNFNGAKRKFDVEKYIKKFMRV